MCQGYRSSRRILTAVPYAQISWPAWKALASNRIAPENLPEHLRDLIPRQVVHGGENHPVPPLVVDPAGPGVIAAAGRDVLL
jgi:hypothetical protein